VYHSILVGQDASQESQRALDLACWIAAATHARLTLTEAESPALANRIGRHGGHEPEPEISEFLIERARRCANKGVSCTARRTEPPTPKGLIHEARWYDLVVVGKPPDVRRHGLGDTADALLSSSPVPVLIADSTPDPPSRLLIAFDDSPDACTALRSAAALAVERNLPLHVLDLIPSRKSHANSHERLRETIDQTPDLNASVETLPGKPAESLLNYIRERAIHLTFLPALDRSLFGHKVTKQLALESRSSLAVPRGQTPPVY
jgi:nucleotide-binding universal stress UspA family protein